MAKEKFSACAIVALALVSSTANACTKATASEPALCPLHLERIAAVRIDRNGAVAPVAQGEESDCSKFQLGVADVKRFFAGSEQTSEQPAVDKVGWSPCYASGALKFADGRIAHWSINRYGTGSLAIEGGKQLFVYCPECEFGPFR